MHKVEKMNIKHNLKTLLFAFFPVIAALSSIVVLSSFRNHTSIEMPTDFTYRKMVNNAFTYGEKLNYRVHYGFINAANIEMEVYGSVEEVYEHKTFHIRAEGKTIKTFDWAYKVRDKFDTYIDQDALCPIKFTKTVREDNYYDTDLVAFKHEKKKLFGSKGVLDMPEYTQDVISALYYARTLDLAKAKKGDTYPIDVYLDNKIYNLKFKYDGKETIKTDIGSVKCYKLLPALIVDRVFKNENDMTIWISEDDNKIPIRIKADIAVGSIKVDITKYSGLKSSFTSLKN
ncbi:MAG: DUF3108 domain-containing protein [Bacteroidia bacterium]|nr:DUF3108 domain-containing protein [Bacteroidia bacterium]